MSVDFCHKNNILLYALPPHTTHILQPSELPFAKLKKEYNKACDKYYRDSGKIVTKHTFARVLDPVLIETYTLLTICNAYKATGIWPFNPSIISSDRLDPSLLTEQFNDLPIDSQHFAQLSRPISTPIQPNYSHFTRSSINDLKEEIIALRNENNVLKTQVEELNTYKNPGTCALRLALKYPVSQPQFQNFQAISENKSESENSTLFLPRKKRKTLPFARLLTNEESLHQLKRLNEEAEQKVIEKKRKKEIVVQKKEAAAQKREIAAQRKAERELNLAKKKEQVKKK